MWSPDLGELPTLGAWYNWFHWSTPCLGTGTYISGRGIWNRRRQDYAAQSEHVAKLEILHCV